MGNHSETIVKGVASGWDRQEQPCAQGKGQCEPWALALWSCGRWDYMRVPATTPIQLLDLSALGLT